MDSGLFHHVTYDHIFKDEKLFYRLQTQSKPKALRQHGAIVVNAQECVQVRDVILKKCNKK